MGINYTDYPQGNPFGSVCIPIYALLYTQGHGIQNFDGPSVPPALLKRFLND